MINEYTQTCIIDWAFKESSYLLKEIHTRWKHVQGVVKKAYKLSMIIEETEKPILIAAAYLHDIGYSKKINKINFHPLDGAIYLFSIGQPRFASLVAHHSEAIFEANLRGLDYELNKFKKEHSIINDMLTYCDLTTDSKGNNVSFQQRLDDIFSKYDENHIVNKAVHNAIPSLSISIKQIEKLLIKNNLKEL